MNENIGDRISEIIQALGIRKVRFAEQINVDQSYVTQLTRGKRNPSDRTINDICREFNVDENWLRTGEGEMFLPMATDGLDTLSKQYPTLTAESLSFIKKLIGMPESKQKVIMSFLREVVQGLNDIVSAPATTNNSEADAKEIDPEAWAEAERQTQRIYEQILEEKKAALSASTAPQAGDGLKKQA